MERKLSNRCVIRFSRALTDAEIKEIYQQFTNSARIFTIGRCGRMDSSRNDAGNRSKGLWEVTQSPNVRRIV